MAPAQEDTSPPSSRSTTAAPPKRKYTPIPGWACADCAKSETPVRRHGPLGPRTLCNACGLRRAKRRKVAEAALAAAKAAGLPPSAVPPAATTTSRRRRSTAPKRKSSTTQQPQSQQLDRRHALPQTHQQRWQKRPTDPTISTTATNAVIPISPEELVLATTPSPMSTTTTVTAGAAAPTPVLALDTAASAATSLVLASSPMSVADGGGAPHPPASVQVPVAAPLAQAVPRAHAPTIAAAPAEPLCWKHNDVELFDSIHAQVYADPDPLALPAPSPVGVMHAYSLFSEVDADPNASCLDAILAQSAIASSPSEDEEGLHQPFDACGDQLRSLHALFANTPT